MRILLYTAVDCSHPGGVQSIVRALRSGLGQKGHRVTTAWSEPTHVDVAGERVIGLHLREGARPFHLPSLMRSLRLSLSDRPQVVHCHFLTRRVRYFLAMRRLFGFKVVLSAHGSDLLRPWDVDAGHLGRILSEADAVTAVSDDLKAAMVDGYGVDADAITVVPNGVDTDFFAPGELRSAVQEATRFVSVGRLEHVKGHDVLLHAFARVVDRDPRARLTLVGDGDEASPLARLADELDLRENVTFAGGLDRDSIRDALRDGDIFVMPSRSEGLPIALLEAMACGLPCVASAVGGIPDLLQDCGMVVPPDRPEALADALLDLASRPSRMRALGRAARETALGFSQRRAVAAYETVYRAALSATTA